MKNKGKTILRVLAVLMLVALLGSCDLLFGLFNNVTVDGARFDLTNLYMSNAEQFDTGKYFMALVLTSDGVSFSGSGGFTGTGEALMLFVATPSTGLAEGTYTYSTTEPPPVPALVMGMAIVGGTYSGWAEPSADALYGVTGGTLAVRTTLTDGYVLEFDVTGINVVTEASATIEGRYRGKVTGTFLLSDMFGGEMSVEAMRSLFN